MRSLANQVRRMSVKAKHMNESAVDFLDNSLKDTTCQNIIKMMKKIPLQELGISGTDSAADAYHFQKPLNRVTIDCTDDYRLVMFFIKKGQEMPLHDHPNMSVYFKLMFGKLSYYSYDKVESKYVYNQFSLDEYSELLETNAQIAAKKSRKKILDKGNLLLVRPSQGNMHKFFAEEDSCFFDIMLPSYSEESLRRITYFNEISDQVTGESHCKVDDDRDREIKLAYHTTPPKLPFDFDVAELDYRGHFSDEGKFYQF